jgi:hypothetical protein
MKLLDVVTTVLRLMQITTRGSSRARIGVTLPSLEPQRIKKQKWLVKAHGSVQRREENADPKSVPRLPQLLAPNQAESTRQRAAMCVPQRDQKRCCV